MIRRTTLILLLALAPAALAAQSPELYVPVTGTIPGADGSRWQGELTLHNAATVPVAATLTLYGPAGALGAHDLTLGARSTITFENVVGQAFGLESATGALSIDLADHGRGRVAVTSRIVNRLPSGEFGQNVPAVSEASTLRAGATAAIPGPARSLDSRFNFGIHAIEATRVQWRLLRADGTLAAETGADFEPGTHAQYNQGVVTLFGQSPRDGDVVHARILEGNAIVYGSIVASSSGDPTFVPGFELREDFAITFIGVDLDEDGTVDVFDADGDGTLDAPVVLYTSFLPNYFKVVTEGGEGDPVTFSLVSAPSGTALIEPPGTVQSYPDFTHRGKTGSIVVRASDGFFASDLVIPVTFR
ncbi:MAG TPA: hypothetical protein VMS56_09420 [Thermoanaerobaculia bacterium]|nr:hypothetical protein [Thermoanaerobaculia bacterium]